MAQIQLGAEPADQPLVTGFAQYLRATESLEGRLSHGAAAIWDALLHLQASRGASGHMLEVGVWLGMSAALMGLHLDQGPESLMLVDRCVGPAPAQDAFARVGVPWGETVRFLQAESCQLLTAPLMQDGFRSFRWIHLEGEHTGGAVRTDLEIADRLLSREGIVCVSDFFSWQYPQVTEAVLAYCREHPERFRLFLCGYDQAFLARPHDVHHSLEYCAGPLVDELEARGVEATLAKTTYPAEMNCFGVGPRLQDFRLRGPDHEQHTIRI